MSQAVPKRVTAGWNQILCYLTSGYDLRKKDSYVDIGFLGLKGGSGATCGVDGTILFQQAGGGGGYGNPCLRNPAQVAQEVKNGIISVKQAKEDYGVVIESETFEVNLKETEKLRRRKK